MEYTLIRVVAQEQSITRGAWVLTTTVFLSLFEPISVLAGCWLYLFISLSILWVLRRGLLAGPNNFACRV